jgi:hypothetical protein
MPSILQMAGHAPRTRVPGAFHAVFARIGRIRHVALTVVSVRCRRSAAFVGK